MKKNKIESETELKLRINQLLLDEFGLNICLEKIEKIKDEHIVNLSYSKIFSILDEPTKTMYIRAIRFKNVYSFDYRPNLRFNIIRMGLNENIRSQFSKLRNEIETSVLENKPLILKLINNTHILAHFLGKLVYLTTNLVNLDKIESNKLKELKRRSQKYENYIKLLIDMGFAEYNDYNDLVTSLKTRGLLEKVKNENGCENIISATVDEILYVIIKENLGYVANVLNLKIIKSLVDIASCLHFFTKYLKIEKLSEISLERFYRIYKSLIGNTTKERLERYLTIFTYSGIVRMLPSEGNLRLSECLA